MACELGAQAADLPQGVVDMPVGEEQQPGQRGEDGSQVKVASDHGQQGPDDEAAGEGGQDAADGLPGVEFLDVPCQQGGDWIEEEEQWADGSAPPDLAKGGWAGLPVASPLGHRAPSPGPAPR